MPRALRDEITFFGHIIQGNRITIKTDDMKVLNPDEDEIFEITVKRIAPPMSLREFELSSFGQSVAEVMETEGIVKDPLYILLLFLHKYNLEGTSFKKQDMSDTLIDELCNATLALHKDKKLAEILRIKLERLRE